MLLLLGWGIMLLSGRADPMHFVRGGIGPSLVGFLFFVGFVALVGGIGDYFRNRFLGRGFRRERVNS